VPATSQDHAEAARIAEAAAELLVGLRGRLADEGVDPRILKDEGDRQSNDLILGALAERFPGDAVLSEEAKDDLARLSAGRVWIVDPLDGTREFSEPPRVDWAVHVALVEDERPIAGAVALPGRAMVLGTEPPPAIAERRPGPPRVVVSRTRPPDVALTVAQTLDGELVEMGSAGAKAMAVLLGEVDVYVHAGGQYEWDSAAPVAVAEAAGLHASRIDGSPLRYNQEDPYLPDLLICRPEFASPVLAVLSP